MSSCLTCQMTKRRDAGEAPRWDAILRTPGWDVVHSYDAVLEGWLVLVLRRHLTAMADLSDDEAAELGPLIKRVSAALHQVTGCQKTYVAQFAEHPDHPHVHVHVIPRASDHPPEARGPRVFAMLGDDLEPVSEARRNELADQIGAVLAG